jgi:hypothetical protein
MIMPPPTRTGMDNPKILDLDRAAGAEADPVAGGGPPIAVLPPPGTPTLGGGSVAST